jgi:hypothetical protein
VTSVAETGHPTGRDDQPALGSLSRADVASTAPLRNHSRLLDVAPIRTPVLDSVVGSRIDTIVDGRVAVTSRLSDTTVVAPHGRDTR